MQVHNITRPLTLQDKKRVGRGGKRGKTSGKGMKGQNSRTGNSKRPELREYIKKFPKLRGMGKNGNRGADIITYYAPVNVAQIEDKFRAGDKVSPKTLIAKGLVEKYKGKIPAIKILGAGEISKKVSVFDCEVSDTAAAKIEKAGGKVV